MPNLEGSESIRLALFLFWVSFFHYLCVYENSDKYNIDRINLVSFVYRRHLLDRKED